MDIYQLWKGSQCPHGKISQLISSMRDEEQNSSPQSRKGLAQARQCIRKPQRDGILRKIHFLEENQNAEQDKLHSWVQNKPQFYGLKKLDMGYAVIWLLTECLGLGLYQLRACPATSPLKALPNIRAEVIQMISDSIVIDSDGEIETSFLKGKGHTQNLTSSRSQGRSSNLIEAWVRLICLCRRVSWRGKGQLQLTLGTYTGSNHLCELLLQCGHWCQQVPLWNPPSSLLAPGPSIALAQQPICVSVRMPQTKQQIGWGHSPNYQQTGCLKTL